MYFVNVSAATFHSFKLTVIRLHCSLFTFTVRPFPLIFINVYRGCFMCCFKLETKSCFREKVGFLMPKYVKIIITCIFNLYYLLRQLCLQFPMQKYILSCKVVDVQIYLLGNMSSSTSSMDGDEVTCPICLEMLKKPIRMLSCGHNLCQVCLESLCASFSSNLKFVQTLMFALTSQQTPNNQKWKSFTAKYF